MKNIVYHKFLNAEVKQEWFEHEDGPWPYETETKEIHYDYNFYDTGVIVIEGNKVTPDQVEDAIIDEKYVKLGNKITVCHLTLQNGHEVIGMAGVVDHTQFDLEIGKRFAREKALDEVWKHLGALLQNQLADNGFI